MIKHIVMWKLDDSYTQEEKASIQEKIKKQLLGLEGKIEELMSIAVGLNHASANAANFDILLDTTFEDMDGLNAYAVHPDHVKVVEYVKTLKLNRACVDYEI